MKDQVFVSAKEGAISIPMEELDAYPQTHSPKVELAAYCRGPYCVNTTEAVEFMQKKGFIAYCISNR